ncbi:MAG: sigma-70 family RNA polymerase sigma factor [Phycisphaerae bacterium]|nr:sigma-70 family RNA polymerase sigma factor [Phycisphaerae bacterium]
MSESENILLRRFAATGDPEAFSEIVQRHAGLVYGACLRVLADKDRAADAVQETFLQLLRNARTITGSVPNWLHRVATRKAIDVVRRDSARKNREAGYAAAKPRQVTKWQDLSRYVDEGLDDLDEQTRQILIRRFFEGRTTIDIATAQNVSQPTISRKIDSGVAQLRGRLRNRGIIVSAAALIGLLGENVVQAAPAAVLQELGKIALVGSEAAAATTVGAAAASATGAGAAASGTGAKVAAGVLAGVKAKVVTAAAVTVVGVGSVVTYNHVTEPSAPQQPTTPVAARQSTPSSSRTPAISAGPAPVWPRAAAMQETDWSQWEGQMWEQIFAEDTSAAPPVVAFPGASFSEEPETTPPAATGGYGGMMYGGMGMGSLPPEGVEEETVEDDANQPGMGYGGFGGAFYGTSYARPPQEGDAPKQELPERVD